MIEWKRSSAMREVFLVGRWAIKLRADQLRELGPDSPLLRPFDGGRSRRLAVCHRPDAAIAWINPVRPHYPLVLKVVIAPVSSGPKPLCNP
jgi:hypothetical protein